MTEENDNWAEISRANQGIPEVTAEWVSENAEKGGFRLIDVREADELVGPLGCINDNEHIPMGDVAGTAGNWKKDEALVVYCRSGGRSGRVVLGLEQSGFTRVASMAGGMLRWNDLSLPLK